MRRVPGPPPGEVVTITPVSFGNDQEPDPIRIKVRHPNEAEKRGLRRLWVLGDPARDDEGNLRYDETGDLLRKITPESQDRYTLELCKSFVVSVENYEDAGGEPIATGEDLFHRGESEILDEVIAGIVGGASLRDREKKTSVDSSASPPMKGAHPAGTAESAGGEALTSHADATREEQQHPAC